MIGVGSPVWHLATGPECVGQVLEIVETDRGPEALVRWDCEECRGAKQWARLTSLRMDGEDE